MVKDIGMDKMHRNKGTVACKGGTLTLELSEHHYIFKQVLGENGSKIPITWIGITCAGI